MLLSKTAVQDHASDPCTSLVQFKTAHRRVQARPTAAQALDSEWFVRGAAAVAQVPDIGIARRIEQFSQYNQVKQSLLMRLASECNQEELLDLRRQFARLDTNRDGTLSLQEAGAALRAVVSGVRGKRVYSDEEIEKVLHLSLPPEHGAVS